MADMPTKLLNPTACIKLMVLTVLQNPKMTERIPYPNKLRRPKHADYLEAYRERPADGEPEGWTGQELLEIVNHLVPTRRWECTPDMMYKWVLEKLEEHGLVNAHRKETVRKGFNSVWYTINNSPDDDPSRPINRMIEQDKENLMVALKDTMAFLRTMDEVVYKGRLFLEGRA